MSNNYLIMMPEITKGMKSIGSKALLKLNATTTILDQQIKLIKSINRRNKIYLSTGFQHAKILKVISKYSNVFTIYEKHYEKYNDGKHLLNFINAVGTLEDIFIINNGILFKSTCFGKHQKNESKIYLLDRPKDNFIIGCQSMESKYLFYDLAHRWCECSYVSNNSLSVIKNMHNIKSIDNYFMFEIINMLLDSNNISYNTISHRDIMKINTANDINRAKRFI